MISSMNNSRRASGKKSGSLLGSFLYALFILIAIALIGFFCFRPFWYPWVEKTMREEQLARIAETLETEQVPTDSEIESKIVGTFEVEIETESETEVLSEAMTEETDTSVETETEVHLSYNLKPLQAMLELQIQDYSGKWSIYVKELGTDGEPVVILDEAMKSASVMKIFIMGTVYEQIALGNLSESEMSEYLTAMIVLSDNNYSNQLLKILGNGSYEDGIAMVNDFNKRHGYTNGTYEFNGFNDAATVFGGHNVANVKDCGAFLEDLYCGALIDEYYSGKMMELLAKQQTKYKIPALLPSGTVIMNKTGETDDTENDVAIIISPNADYTLCVLSNQWNDKADAILEIQAISRTVYEYFNGEVGPEVPLIMYEKEEDTENSENTENTGDSNGTNDADPAYE